MQTVIHKSLKKHPAIKQANEILRSCVHCGFCNATCPTYQLLGDELDGPRGRIYLIKQLIETGVCTEQTREHLDRCLTCRNCETTCPSGVEYGRLLSVGRELAEKNSPRKITDIILRRLLRIVIPYRRRISLIVKIALKLKVILPASIQRQLPHNEVKPKELKKHSRRIIIPKGCAQDAFAADINADCHVILNQLGISSIEIDSDTCCGAMSEHLSQPSEAKMFMKKNIDAWWPEIESGAEAIVSTASGCGVMIKDYVHLLANDTEYADKAARISESCVDISELLYGENLSIFENTQSKKISFHAPCTLQHGQKITHKVEAILTSIGYKLIDYNDAHLCCGSAGTYSILENKISKQLLSNKINHLLASKPDIIATANIGCLLHMRSATETPIKHWLQLINPAKD